MRKISILLSAENIENWCGWLAKNNVFTVLCGITTLVGFFITVYISVKTKSPLENKNPLAAIAQISSFDSKTFFDSDNSFIALIKDNYVVIHARISDRNDVLAERLTLMLVPSTYKDVYKYVDGDDDSELLRLQTLIKSSFPNSLDIANDILGMSAEIDE